MEIKTKKVFVANDGKEFDTEIKCTDYERHLNVTYYFKILYNPISINNVGEAEYGCTLYAKCRVPRNTIRFYSEIEKIIKCVIIHNLYINPIILIDNRYCEYVSVKCFKDNIKFIEKDHVYDLTNFLPKREDESASSYTCTKYNLEKFFNHLCTFEKTIT
jgi:hypothetical protein